MPAPLIHQMELGPMANYAYLVGDPESHQAVAIDPTDDIPNILARASKDKLEITAVLLTHGHFDHVGGVPYFANEMQLPVYISEQEFLLYMPRVKKLIKIQDDKRISLGTLTIQCIHTPGHTSGCMCFLIENNLFTGDTLFIDAVGRADLPGSDSRKLYQSLQKIKTLPDNIMIWPGHNYGEVSHAPLGQLKQTNPFLVCQTETDFENNFY